MNDSTWTWVSGNNSIYHQGVYGVKGHASTLYMPASRGGAAGWFDSLKQEFWVFGGFAYFDTTTNAGKLFDIFLSV